jgi:hypothetical protein
MRKNSGSSSDAPTVSPTWAPRVPRKLIERLYKSDADGFRDEDLANEVGCALLVRCESMIEARAAVDGSVKCPSCGTAITHAGNKEETLVCHSCHWSVPWGDYLKTFSKQELIGGLLEPYIEAFIREYPRVRAYRRKVIQIDRLIHRFHGELNNHPGRLGGANFIDGPRKDLVEFLNSLTYGQNGTSELQLTKEKWDQTVQALNEKRQVQTKRRRAKEKERKKRRCRKEAPESGDSN